MPILTAASDGQIACPNPNVSTQWNITVNVTTSIGEEGHFNASISKGLCSINLTVYTNDSLLTVTGSITFITLVYIRPSGNNTTVRIAYGKVARQSRSDAI